MRLLALIFFLASTLLSAAAESQADYSKRVLDHFNRIRYDPVVWQASHRSNPKNIVIQFSIAPDGAIKGARIVKSDVSAELGRFIIRAVNKLPPLKNVQQPNRPVRIIVTLGKKPG